jgi:nucleoside-diphosphate-sugar epimerase
MEKIFITGGSGFIGTNAMEYFLQQNYTVKNFDAKAPQNPAHHSYWIKGNINDEENYYNAVKDFNPSFFLHLAARTDLDETKDLHKGYKSNILGVNNTINIINKIDSIKRVLFASSRLVCKIDYTPKNYDDYCPPNLYGESKMIGELLVKEDKINKEWVLFRPTSIWGPWFGIPYKLFFETIQKNLYFHQGNLNPLKSFGYVKNTIYQLDKLLHAPLQTVNKKIFYLCDYPPLYLREWSRLIQQELNSRKIPEYPLFLLRGAAYIGDLFSKIGFQKIPITSFRLNNLITNMVYDTTALQAICGQLPYNLHAGVKETVGWMKTGSN